jgi:hypothetical protein
MNNNTAVNRQKLHREMNSFARKVIDCDYSRDMIIGEIENRYGNISSDEREMLFYYVLEKSYRYVWSVEGKTAPSRLFRLMSGVVTGTDNVLDFNCVRSSAAMHIFTAVIDNIQKLPQSLDRGNCFSDAFYASCVRDLASCGALKSIEDADVLIIYLKQAAIILKNTPLFSVSNGIARVNSDGISLEELYLEVFSAFWNRVRWDEIFCSNPGASRELMKTKHILVDMMLNAPSGVTVDTIANDFFRDTGFGVEGDLYMISFLDFYFFAWMELFGIVRYARKRNHDAVSISITEHGRRFLQFLQKSGCRE